MPGALSPLDAGRDELEAFRRRCDPEGLVEGGERRAGLVGGAGSHGTRQLHGVIRPEAMRGAKLRRLVEELAREDYSHKTGRFLGSSPWPVPRVRTPARIQAPGRIVTVRMRPLAFSERQIEQPTVSLAGLLEGHHSAVEGETKIVLDGYVDEILRSGFPGIRAY